MRIKIDQEYHPPSEEHPQSQEFAPLGDEYNADAADPPRRARKNNGGFYTMDEYLVGSVVPLEDEDGNEIEFEKLDEEENEQPAAVFEDLSQLQADDEELRDFDSDFDAEDDDDFDDEDAFGDDPYADDDMDDMDEE